MWYRGLVTLTNEAIYSGKYVDVAVRRREKPSEAIVHVLKACCGSENLANGALKCPWTFTVWHWGQEQDNWCTLNRTKRSITSFTEAATSVWANLGNARKVG